MENHLNQSESPAETNGESVPAPDVVAEVNPLDEINQQIAALQVRQQQAKDAMRQKAISELETLDIEEQEKLAPILAQHRAVEAEYEDRRQQIVERYEALGVFVPESSQMGLTAQQKPNPDDKREVIGRAVELIWTSQNGIRVSELNRQLGFLTVAEKFKFRRWMLALDAYTERHGQATASIVKPKMGMMKPNILTLRI